MQLIGVFALLVWLACFIYGLLLDDGLGEISLETQMAMTTLLAAGYDLCKGNYRLYAAKSGKDRTVYILLHFDKRSNLIDDTTFEDVGQAITTFANRADGIAP